MRRSLLLALLLVACSEYDLKGEGDANPDDEEDTDLPDDDTDVPDDGDDTVAEECNGVDDDGDGEVDEGYPDTDGDGRADCVDEDCEVDAPAGGSVDVNTECLAPDIVITDPWNVAIEWQYTVTGSSSGVIVMPAIGNLTDDNGDGYIDQNDSPDIVFTTWGDNTLVALHGDGSGTIFTKTGYDGNAGVAIADVDNDGVPEIVAANTSKQVVVLNGAGTVEWTSAQSYAWQYYPQPVVADLEGDGDVEIIFDIAIVEGSNGAHVSTITGITSSWRAPVVADIDADGFQEILLAENVYDHTGVKKWGVPRVGDSTFAAVGDIDGDIGGESFWVTGSTMYIVDDDGTILTTTALNSSCYRPGPPAVADFDGDGDIEVVVPASSQIEMFDTNGVRTWQSPVQDSSGIAGASGYDINADGIYEVLYADEVMLRIFDGATGTVLYSNSSHSSGTLWEYPVVADVDGDDSAEIVIASNGAYWKGVTVLGHNGDGWAKSGATWPVHDFAVTNIDPNGHVPSPAPLPWSVYNVFRARPTVDDAAVDLAVEIVDVCFAGCTDESSVDIAVQVQNLGGVEAPAGIQVALYAVGGTAEDLLLVQTLTDSLPSGQSTDALLFEITQDMMGADGIMVRVDDDGTGLGAQNECDESNNEDRYAESPC